MGKSNKVPLNDVMGILREFINGNFLSSAGLDSFANNDSFLEEGIIDSTGVMELLAFIEEKFAIRVEDEEIIPDNLDSLNNLTSFIERKIASAGE
jgi:acyl carrier protein